MPVQGKHSLQMMRAELSLKVTLWRAGGAFPWPETTALLTWHNSAGSIPHTPNQKKRKSLSGKKLSDTKRVAPGITCACYHAQHCGLALVKIKLVI